MITADPASILRLMAVIDPDSHQLAQHRVGDSRYWEVVENRSSWPAAVVVSQLVYDTLGGPGTLTDALDVLDDAGTTMASVQNALYFGPADCGFVTYDDQWGWGAVGIVRRYSRALFTYAMRVVDTPRFFITSPIFCLGFKTGVVVKSAVFRDSLGWWTVSAEDAEMYRGQWVSPLGRSPYDVEWR
jgi:hypothetical protein